VAETIQGVRQRVSAQVGQLDGFVEALDVLTPEESPSPRWGTGDTLYAVLVADSSWLGADRASSRAEAWWSTELEILLLCEITPHEQVAGFDRAIQRAHTVFSYLMRRDTDWPVDLKVLLTRITPEPTEDGTVVRMRIVATVQHRLAVT